MSEFREAFLRVLSDPSVDPPEWVFQLDLSRVEYSWDLLSQIQLDILVRFVLEEVKLVLPLWERRFPGDSQIGVVIDLVEEWLTKLIQPTRSQVLVAYSDMLVLAYSDMLVLAREVNEIESNGVNIHIPPEVGSIAHIPRAVSNIVGIITDFTLKLSGERASGVLFSVRMVGGSSVEDQLRRLLCG